MGNDRIKKIFIANRAEIALRIKRACDKKAIPCVVGVSQGDSVQSFAKSFNEVVILGPSPAAQSYLNSKAIIEAALKTGCNAIHPGYGFLSENAEFAREVINNGLIFIGPTPESIEALGNKTRARETVIKHGVPCVPGSEGRLTDEEIIGFASKIGFPVIIKAAAGGGGL